MRRFAMTHLTILSLAALAVAGCAKDPTAGKAAATVAEAKAVEKPAAAPSEATETLAVTPGASKIGFVGAKITDQHVGDFKDFKGSIALVNGSIEAGSLSFEVKPGSVIADGGNPKLEGHLISPDFFDVEKFPTASFVSTSIKAGSDAEGMTHTVTGNLELRGTTKSVTFPAAIEVGTAGVKATTEFGINRKDFGIEYPGMPDDLIKDNVLIRVSLDAPRATAAN